MNSRPILVCDFDGVIVDGMNEYWWSARQACIELLPDECGPDLLPEKVPQTFRKLRPWIHHGWEMVVIAAEHLRTKEPLKIEEANIFAENYPLRLNKALKHWGWNSSQVQEALESVRQKELAFDRASWLAQHRAFPNVVERLQILENESIDLIVLTTKGREFTNEILQHLNLKPKQVFGHEAGSKSTVLLDLARTYSIKGFIEDRRETLETIISIKQLSNIPCYLASWGYLKPKDIINLPKGIHILKTEIMNQPLKNWA